MKNWFSKIFEQMTPEVRNVFLIGISNLFGLVMFTVAISVFAVTTNSWQFAVQSVIVGICMITGAIGLVLIQRGRLELAIKLIVYSVMPAIVLSTALISGVGLMTGIIVAALTYMNARQVMPSKQANRTGLIAVGAGIAVVLMDLYLPTTYRFPAPAAFRTFTIVGASLVFVLISVIALRQFRNFSLRAKLIAGFLLVALIPLGVMFFLNNQNTRQNLTNDADTALRSAAAATASELDFFLEESLAEARSAAQFKHFQEYLEIPAAERAGSEPEAGMYNDLRAIASINPVYITSVGLIDARGIDIADTYSADVGLDKTGRVWFTTPIERGLPYISPLELSEALGQYSLYFSAPVRNADGKILGVLRIRYNADVLQKIIVDAAESEGLQDSAIDLFDENHIFLAITDAPEEINKTVAPLPADKLAQLQAERRLPEGSAESLSINDPELEQGLNNASQQPNFTLESGNEEAAVVTLKNQSWVVLFSQNRDVFLAPLEAQSRASALLAVVIAALVAAAGFFVAQSLSAPIVRLTAVATEVAGGNLSAQARVESNDEIGTLASTFNNMSAQLKNTLDGLELTVANRTRALATSTEVSRRLSTILNQKELVTEVVNQVNSAFSYYHTQIYFYDQANENLVMAGGTGEAGQTMLARGHKILKGKGLVGRAADSNEAVLVSDTLQDSEWLSNPLLPDTKSEVAIPISIGDQVLGVLDAQQNITDGLQQEDVDALQSIANQVAVALQNIRQYENTQKIASDMGVVANVGIATSTITDATLLLQEVVDLSKKSFKLYHAHIYLLNEAGDSLELTSGAGEVGRQMVAEKRRIALDSEQSLVARAARTREGVVVNDVTLDPNFLPNPLLPDTRAELAVPMIVAGKVIGVLDVQSETVNRFTDVDVSIKTTLASQLAVALQNARSFSQSQRQAERESAVNLITQKIQNTTTIEAALQMTARELGRALGMKQTIVSLDPTAENKGN